MSRIFERYLLAKPDIRGIFEWMILVVSGLYGYCLSVLPLPFSCYFITLGIVVFILGLIIHGLSHKEHRQAHFKTEKIEKLVTTGIYSKIRHPGYLGVILMYFGVAFLLQSLLPLVIAIILSVLHILTALKEEEYLLRKFGKEYEAYMRKVRWRFIPKIF